MKGFQLLNDDVCRPFMYECLVKLLKRHKVRNRKEWLHRMIHRADEFEPAREGGDLSDKISYNKFIEYLSKQVQKMEPSQYEDLLEQRLLKLQSLFKLSDAHLMAIKFLYYYDQSDNFSDLFDTVLGHNRSHSKTLYTLSVCCLEKEVDYHKEFSLKSNLVISGLVDEDLDISKQAVSFLGGNSETALDESYFKDLALDESLPLDFFEEYEKEIKMLKSILKKPSKQARHILFYGMPGAGKSSLAQALAVELNKKLYSINLEIEYSPRRGNSRMTALYACNNAIPHKNSIVLVDEADTLLHGIEVGFMSHSGSKDKINDYLDTCRGSYIWICNEINGVHPSTRRRFDYSLSFEKLSDKARMKVLVNILKKEKIDHIPKRKLKEILSKEDLNPGGLAIVFKNYKKINDGVYCEHQLDELIAKHALLMTGQSKKDKAGPSHNYSLKGLNINGDRSLKEIKALMKSFLKKGHQEINNMNMLLYGPPGTGKTEFVKHLAEKLKVKSVMVNASEMLDMYVGGTEANIRKAFSRANGGILFFDEIDSLLRSRSDAQRSWEVTQVNAMLSCMENFKGVFIGASNSMEALDPASLRRFNFKLEFNYLDYAGVKHFYKRLLVGLCDSAKYNESDMKNLDKLTVGDFKVVRQQYLLSPQKPTHEDLISSLRQEVEIKNQGRTPIGFA